MKINDILHNYPRTHRLSLRMTFIVFLYNSFEGHTVVFSFNSID